MNAETVVIFEIVKCVSVRIVLVACTGFSEQAAPPPSPDGMRTPETEDAMGGRERRMGSKRHIHFVDEFIAKYRYEMGRNRV